MTGFQRYKDIWWRYYQERDVWVLCNSPIFSVASVCYFKGDMLITDCIERFNKFLNEGV